MVPALLAAFGAAQGTGARVRPGGVLFGTPCTPDAPTRVVGVYSLENRHLFPTRSYSLDTKDLHSATEVAGQRGLHVVGWWSGQLDAAPEQDRDTDLSGEFVAAAERAPVISMLIGVGSGRAPLIRAFAWGADETREVRIER